MRHFTKTLLFLNNRLLGRITYITRAFSSNINTMKKFSKPYSYFKKLVLPIIFIFILVILLLSVKGINGNPNDNNLNDVQWKDSGPLELSPDRGRFALTYSLAENRSTKFSLPVARFATPDLGYKDGNYVSLFAPGVSFIILPGYLIGRIFDLSQFGSFLIIAFFAFINFWLIYLISKSLGSKKYSSLIAAGIFSLATPALAYGGSLYQHHISTFFILCSIWILFRFKSAWSLIPIWLMIGSSVVVDNPNFFMMFPIGVFALGRMVSFERISSRVSVKIKPFVIFTVLTMILPLAAFMYFNKLSYGSLFQLSGTVESVQEIDINGQPAKSSLISESNVDVSLDLQASEEKHSKSAVGFFESRNMLNGFYTQFFSQDRGILFFSPIILLGLLGIIISYKKLNSTQVLLLSVLAANMAIYAMWGDPWGGWAFGSRYLIPAYAILAIFLSSVLTSWNRKILFILLMYPVLIYSVGVNMVGALTSNRNPPKKEILALEKLSGVEEKYTVERNWDYLQKDSKAFVYRAFLNERVSPLFYFYTLAGLSVAMFTFLIVANYFDKSKEEK